MGRGGKHLRLHWFYVLPKAGSVLPNPPLADICLIFLRKRKKKKEKKKDKNLPMMVIPEPL